MGVEKRTTGTVATAADGRGLRAATPGWESPRCGRGGCLTNQRREEQVARGRDPLWPSPFESTPRHGGCAADSGPHGLRPGAEHR